MCMLGVCVCVYVFRMLFWVCACVWLGFVLFLYFNFSYERYAGTTIIWKNNEPDLNYIYITRFGLEPRDLTKRPTTTLARYNPNDTFNTSLMTTYYIRFFICIQLGLGMFAKP